MAYVFHKLHTEWLRSILLVNVLVYNFFGRGKHTNLTSFNKKNNNLTLLLPEIVCFSTKDRKLESPYSIPQEVKYKIVSNQRAKQRGRTKRS